LMAEEMAHDFRLPIVRIIEGSGGGGSVKTIETKGAANLPGGIGGTRWYRFTTENLSRVPVVALGLGSVAGLGAARLAASHYSIMTKSSAMFVAGPPVVKRLGQDLTKQELGGADIQTRAGGIDHAVETEEEAFECAKRFLSYLPSSVYELPPTIPCNDDPERAEESLMKAVPRNRRQVYKMRPIIEAVVDKGSFFEVAANFGRPVITGLARLEGRAVFVLASDPFHYGGSWTAEACQKVVRWVDFAETFHLPVVYLMDCPGFMIGLEAEKSATIRHGVRAMAAVNQSTVPWCTIIVRNAFGVAGVVHQPANRFSMRHRGGLSRRHRGRPRSRSEIERDRGPSQQAALAVPLGREILGRGGDRSPQDPLAPVRVCAPCRTDPQRRAAEQHDDAAVMMRVPNSE
jgi:acetyl-CoA carboxylase carboxyltransferase component